MCGAIIVYITRTIYIRYWAIIVLADRPRAWLRTWQGRAGTCKQLTQLKQSVQTTENLTIEGTHFLTQHFTCTSGKRKVWKSTKYLLLSAYWFTVSRINSWTQRPVSKVAFFPSHHNFPPETFNLNLPHPNFKNTCDTSCFFICYPILPYCSSLLAFIDVIYQEAC